MSAASEDILCVGEVLWDALPEGLFLGGAPFNVAGHLHALGEEAALVSRVGDDRLGREALRRMQARGMTTDLVQVDTALETGFVRVALDDEGDAAYAIEQPAAWDALALPDVLAQRAAQAEAIVFGSLAQRQETARRTVRRLGATDALKAYDVNLRPPHTPPHVVEASLHDADVVKMNEEELARVGQELGLPDTPREAAEALARRFGGRSVCVTRGAQGSALWRDGTWTEHPGYSVAVQDTVGAGDAFLAALLAGLLAGWASERMLDAANRLGAFVASRSGAVPAYEVGSLDAASRLPLESGATP